MIAELDRERKEGVDEIDLISARIADLPWYMYVDNQNLVTSETITQEVMSLMDHYTRQDFSLGAFDKLLEIQVNFEVLETMLKDEKKKFVEAEDMISRVRVITDST